MRGKAQATTLTTIAVQALEKPESKLHSAPEATWDNTPICEGKESKEKENKGMISSTTLAPILLT